MKFIILILILFLLGGCAGQGWTGRPHPPNACVLAAANKEATLNADAFLHPILWRKILFVQYQDGFVQKRHAYCVFKTSEGHVYAYDERGAERIEHDSTDAMVIAKQMKEGVITAEYESGGK